MSPTQRSRFTACLITAIAYLATTWFSVRLLGGALADVPTAARVLVALMPIIPIGFAIRAVVRLMRDGDELQRRIDVEALAIAGLVVGLGTLTLSLLLESGAFETTATHALMWVLPALSVTYVAARSVASRRYQ
ncbi:MAG: hypothetical protein ABI650_01280 [Dokdonella sp.]